MTDYCRSNIVRIVFNGVDCKFGVSFTGGELMLSVLDLYCGAGGASHGLWQAGFELVVGVDNSPQPRYPFAFLEMDALDTGEILQNFDFVWASPPCQVYTAYQRSGNVAVEKHVDLIAETREMLERAGVYYVIENVPGSPLQHPVQLCGSSFGLDIRRHRWFESNFQLFGPPCKHGWQRPRFPCAGNRRRLRKTVEIGVWRIPLETQQHAMGINWMDKWELSQAVPPAFSKYIGESFLSKGEKQGFIF